MVGFLVLFAKYDFSLFYPTEELEDIDQNSQTPTSIS